MFYCPVTLIQLSSFVYCWQVSEDCYRPYTAMEVCQPAQQRKTGNGDKYKETGCSWQPG